MASSYLDEDHADNPVLDLIFRVLYAIRGSFTVFVFALGAVCLAVAFVLETGLVYQSGVMAGMFFIWGVSMMLYAVIFRLGLRAIGYTK